MADGFHGDKDQPCFNFFEFLTLAHKVVNSGDVSAMAALSDLKQKWELQYGRPARFPAKTPRHVQPPVRRVVRCLLDDPAVPKQPLNNSNAAAEFSDSAAEIPAFSAAFCAGKQPEDELGMAQKSQQQSTALLGGNSMEIQQNDAAAESESAAEIPGQGIRHNRNKACVLTDLESEMLWIRCRMSSMISNAMVVGVLSVLSNRLRFLSFQCGIHMLRVVLYKTC
ncbi:UNVERIFIED_CONTAM: hypothetical protein Sindi_2321000 [Sesamum indicum]